VQENAELSLIWALAQKMWQKDLPATYEALRKDWSDNVKSIMAVIQGRSPHQRPYNHSSV